MASCSATRKDGTPCSAQAQSGSRFCWGHDPRLAERRRESSARGGANKATNKRLDKLTPASLRPVLDTLYAALEGLQDGSKEPKTATAMASVAGVIVRVHEASEMEARLRALEGAGNERRG